MPTITRRRRLAYAGLGLASAAVTVTATAPNAAADAPPPVTVICQTATFYQNYDSGTGSPVNALDVKTYGQTVGFTKGANPVYNGSWAQVFDWHLETWGVILYSCLDHG